MAAAEFADLRNRLVGEAEDAGLGLPELIEVLKDQAEAMQSSGDE